jgi:predicted transcriptional regulator
MKLLDLPKYGPVHRFADYHVYRTLLLLSDGRRRGRKQLADAINLGEGSMRTILEFLREKGYIDVKQTGIKISSKGHEFLRSIPIRMERLEPSDISIAERNVAVLVKGRASAIALGIEQRDAAIKAGADGATTIVLKGGKMLVPPDYHLDKEKPEIARKLRKLFALNDGDIVIVGAAEEYDRAEDGALAAAFALL